MTVKDIFDLRKQGRIEEAYEAIKARYKVYRGKYTILCMFWTARDIFNIRMAAGRIDEARKIYEALKRVLPNIDDRDGKAAAFMAYAHRRLLQRQLESTPQIRVICVIRGRQKKFPYLVVPSLMPCPPVSKQSSTASRPMRE